LPKISQLLITVYQNLASIRSQKQRVLDERYLWRKHD